MDSVRVSSQLLVSGLFIAVHANTEKLKFFPTHIEKPRLYCIALSQGCHKLVYNVQAKTWMQRPCCRLSNFVNKLYSIYQVVAWL